jgi:hypothetical protein
VLKFAGYSFPETFAKSDAQDIAESLERIMAGGPDPEIGGILCDNHHHYPYDDDSCIEMN